MARNDERLLVLGLSGEFSVESVEALREAIARRQPSAALVLDLSDLDFIDTSGLRVLIDTQRRSEEPPEWRFALVPGRRSLHRTFEIAGLTAVMRFVESPEDVL